MKVMYLIRHAEAIGKRAGLPDFERSLVKKGEKESLRVARRFVKNKSFPDALISSPANRALETAHIFCGVMGYAIENIQLRQEIYEAQDGQGLMNVVASLNDTIGSVALFGHEPSLSQLAALLMPSFSGSIPKCGIVGISFDIDSWAQLAGISGKPVFCHFPMPKLEKDRALDMLRKTMVREMSNRMHQYLGEMDNAAADRVVKNIEKIAKRAVDLYFKEMNKRDLLQLYWKHGGLGMESMGDKTHDCAEAGS